MCYNHQHLSLLSRQDEHVREISRLKLELMDAQLRLASRGSEGSAREMWEQRTAQEASVSAAPRENPQLSEVCKAKLNVLFASPKSH